MKWVFVFCRSRQMLTVLWVTLRHRLAVQGEPDGWEIQVGATGVARTVLEQRIKQRRLTLEEFVNQLEGFARQNGEPGTLGLRHLNRLIAGEFGPEKLKPATARLLEAFFDSPIEELLGTPERISRSDRVKLGLVAAKSTRVKLPLVVELEAALSRYALHSPISDANSDGGPVSLEGIERDLSVAFSSYQQSRFGTAASRVTTLLVDAQRATLELGGARQVRAFGLLALTYQVCASLLIKADEPGLAWVAADRGLAAAESSESSSIKVSLMRSVAFSLLSTGQLESAMRLAESGAQYLESDVARDDVAASVYGTLLLAGAMAAARFGDAGRTSEYLHEADRAARRLGRDANHLWTAFGPSNVAIHRANTAAELDDMQTVLDSGLSLNPSAVPVERRVRYLLDVARAQSLAGSRDDALQTMLAAERIAPEHIRQHHLSKKVVTNLVQRSVGKPSLELGKLARRVNFEGAVR